MEPLSIIAIGAAVGGAAGKFVEKAWDSGEKWIITYFKDHKEIAQKKATENSMDFLNELAMKIKNLEDSHQITKEKIDSAQDHPDFSILLQKALITSSQTEDKEKHKILAKIVSERMKSDPETIISLSSKIACDAISFATNNQLMILGLAVNFFGIRPNFYNQADFLTQEKFQENVDKYLTIRLKPYQNILIRQLDISHLESISCLKNNSFISRGYEGLFDHKNLKYDWEKMKDKELNEFIKKIWSQGFANIELTTVGQIIGVSVSDLVSNTNTLLKEWE